MLHESFFSALFITLSFIGGIAFSLALGATFFWMLPRLQKLKLVQLLCCVKHFLFSALVSGLRRIVVWAVVILSALVIAPVFFSVRRAANFYCSHEKYIWMALGAFVVAALPFFVFFLIHLPLPSLLGISVAGGIIGCIAVPFSVWKYRRQGLVKAISISGIVFLSSVWGAHCLMATLIAMASD